MSHLKPQDLNLNITRQSRDASPQRNLYIPRPQDSKHANSIKPYRPKKLASNSPLGHKDNSDSKSRLDSRSTSKCDQNSRKQLETQSKPIKKKSSRELEQIYSELLALKSEYKNLKHSYNCLLREKQQFNEDAKVKSEEYAQLQHEHNRVKKELDRTNSQLQFCQHQLERIKKQCFKLLEIEHFKNTKLEETLQEKELMIQYLRAQIGKDVAGSQNILLQSTTPIFRANTVEHKFQSQKPSYPALSSLEEIFTVSQADHEKSKILLSSISQNARNLSNVSQDSLSFCKDHKSIPHESIITSPPKVKNQAQPLPNCCTFELKQYETEKNNKAIKKNLTIDTDENQDLTNVYCDLPSISTKKRSAGKKRSKEEDKQIKECTHKSLERRMRKFQVQAPKTRKSRDKTNMNYR